MMPGGCEVRSGRIALRLQPSRSLRESPLYTFAFQSRVVINSKEIEMSKGQQKGNRETKKPKKEKIKVIAAAPSQKPSFGSGKKK